MWSCMVRDCAGGKIQTDVRSFIFKHYSKHLYRDILNTAEDLGISKNPRQENKRALINAIINFNEGLNN